MPSITEAFQNLYTYIISIAGIMALVALTWGGILYLTSAGDSEKLSRAKKQILAALFGMVILFGSYIILRTINPQLVQFDLARLKQIIFHPLQAPPSETYVPELLGKVEDIAKRLKEEAIPGIETSSQKIKELTSNCDCSNTQALCACISPSTAKKIAIKKIYSLEYLDNNLLEILKKHPETPCDTFHCSLFDTKSLHLLATKQIPGTNTFIAQSETEKIEQAAEEGKDVFTDDKVKEINKADISILHSEDFIAKYNEYIDKDLKDGCINKEKADFLKKNASKVTAAADRQGNIMVNKEKVEERGLERASETFTHEYAHVVDGPELQFSHSDEWKNIYSRSVGYKLEYKEKRLKEVIEWKEKGGELSPAVRSPGFVSDYAYYGGEHEDFAETVRVYRKSEGDPNQVTNDPKSQQLIKERFDFLKKKKIVKPDYKKPEKEKKKKTSSILLTFALNAPDFVFQPQAVKISNSSSGPGTCYGIQCYAGPGFQPCPDEAEIKENQKNIIAWKDEILYYRNRAIAEEQDLQDEIKKVLDEKIIYYIKNEEIEDDEKVKQYLKDERAKITEEKNLKKDLAAKLQELADLIEQIEPFMSEIAVLPDKCLDDDVFGVNNRCQASCKGGCHDIESGCQPVSCSGGNPCPVGEINDQFLLIQNLSTQITQVCDEILHIIEEIIKHKTITI